MSDQRLASTQPMSGRVEGVGMLERPMQRGSLRVFDARRVDRLINHRAQRRGGRAVVCVGDQQWRAVARRETPKEIGPWAAGRLAGGEAGLRRRLAISHRDRRAPRVLRR
jgi:hypothetical protein